MKSFRKYLQIGIVLSLSSIFIYCGGNSNKAGNDNNINANNVDTQQEALHSYDITLKNDSETLHYSSSVDMDEFIPSLYVEDAEAYVGKDTNATVITLGLNDARDFTIDAMFVIDENGVPLPIKMGRQSQGLGSTLRLVDHNTERAFTGVSGTVAFHNLKRDMDPGYGLNGDIASYTVNFEGEFDYLMPETGEYIRYTGTGKVVIAPFEE